MPSNLNYFVEGEMLINVDALPCTKVKNSVSNKQVWCGALILAVVVGLSACGSKEKKAGQSLVKVNGVEITILQLNDELKFAGVRAEQQEVASKQLLESLIDRQLILEEAMRNKMDHTPEIMQAIERAKAQIIAQTYLKSVTSKIAKPSKAEINDYYQKHPEFFALRKEFVLKQLVFANNNFSDELRLFMDSAQSLDEVAAWMDKQGVKYARGQTTRSTADLPEQVVAKLLGLQKGKLFLASEGNNRVLSMLTAVNDSPVTALNAEPQIEQFLINKMSRDAVEMEITHLRSIAKIEYLNASAPAAGQSPAIVPDKKADGSTK
jgi:peptidyl-prolyl cis-trans isomerase C